MAADPWSLIFQQPHFLPSTTVPRVVCAEEGWREWLAVAPSKHPLPSEAGMKKIIDKHTHILEEKSMCQITRFLRDQSLVEAHHPSENVSSCPSRPNGSRGRDRRGGSRGQNKHEFGGGGHWGQYECNTPLLTDRGASFLRRSTLIPLANEFLSRRQYQQPGRVGAGRSRAGQRPSSWEWHCPDYWRGREQCL